MARHCGDCMPFVVPIPWRSFHDLSSVARTLRWEHGRQKTAASEQAKGVQLRAWQRRREQVSTPFVRKGASDFPSTTAICLPGDRIVLHRRDLVVERAADFIAA